MSQPSSPSVATDPGALSSTDHMTSENLAILQRLTSSSSRRALIKPMIEFFDDPTTRPEDLQALHAFLKDRPVRRETISYLSEVEQRLEAAAKLEKYRQERGRPPFTAAFWSAIMVIPWDQLKIKVDKWLDSDSSIFLSRQPAMLPLVFKLCKLLFLVLPPQL